MAGHQLAHHLEPKGADLRQQATFIGDAIGHDHVVGADAVGGDDQQTLVAQVVYVADLAGTLGVVADGGCQDGCVSHTAPSSDP